MAALTERSADGGVATQARIQPVLAPPDLVVPVVFPPEFTVNVYETSGGPTLVAVLELVSPANKDRADSRRAFAGKCAGYLYRGLGLIVVDVVTSRLSRPLEDLLTLLDPALPYPDAGNLTAVSYRPARTNDADSIEFRIKPLAAGAPLPELPLFLDAGRVVTVDLEATYQEVREKSRM
ncbi:hypothetical protein FRUB_08709 [Fimbriiglobus ruber]|uniref:Uncharacterized protein n=1 Tax=Fimbriiglobus ruber TaxID=1908690 RepID=A0A225DFL7_9BACT|nr:hypothetical protein FRUB_08709 [Fimbriiglobus ruber]